MCIRDSMYSVSCLSPLCRCLKDRDSLLGTTSLVRGVWSWRKNTLKWRSAKIQTETIVNFGAFTRSTETPQDALNNASTQTDVTTTTDSVTQIDYSSLSLDFTRYHPSFRSDLINFIAHNTSLLPMQMLQPHQSTGTSTPTSKTDETVSSSSTATADINDEVDSIPQSSESVSSAG